MSTNTKTAKMQPGDTFTVRAGEFAGKQAVVVDAKPFPDTDLSRRRKITVEVEGERVYLLPRLLETNVVAAPVAQPSNVVPITATPSHGSLVPDPETGTPIIVPGNITDPDDPRLDPWRPGKGDRKAEDKILRDYINRTMANGSKDTDFLLDFYDHRENVLLVGDTQSGKTMMVNVLAILAGRRRESGKALPVFTLSGSSGVTDFDLFGQPTTFVDEATGRERLVMLAGVVDLAVRSGSILYLDEANMMGERTTSSLHPVADDRQSFVNRMKAIQVIVDNVEVFMPDVVEATDTFWIIGTINPAGYKGTSMNEAFLNRFTSIPWGYDETVEKRLVPSAAVRLLGQALREARAARALNTPIGTSALSRMCSHVDRFGPEMAIWMLVGMFLPQEQPKVQAIVTDRSIQMLLTDEVQAKNSQAWTPPSVP